MNARRGVCVALPLFVWGGLLFAPVSWRTVLAGLVALVVAGAVDYRWHGEDAKKDKEGKVIPARDPDPRSRFSKPLFFTALMVWVYTVCAFLTEVNGSALAWWVLPGMLAWPSLWWWAVIALDWEPKAEAPTEDREKGPVIRRKSGINALPIGRDIAENRVYRMPFGPGMHTLVVGQTGSGKGGLIWAMACTLLPYQKQGIVEMYGIDPKLGMEMSKASWVFKELLWENDHGDGFYDRVVDFLEDRVVDMKRRAAIARNMGVDKLEPSAEYPLQVIIIDELVELTMMMPSELRRRFTEAVTSLLTMGRAPGYVVVGLTVNAREDVLGAIREYFVNVVGMSMRTATDVDVAFGPTMRKEYDLKCHKIVPRVEVGRCYVVDRELQLAVLIQVDNYTADRIRSFRAKYGTYDDKMIAAGDVEREVVDGVDVEYVEPEPAHLSLIEKVADWWPKARRRAPGWVHVEDIAAQFGVSVEEVKADLDAVGIVPSKQTARSMIDGKQTGKDAVRWPDVEPWARSDAA